MLLSFKSAHFLLIFNKKKQLYWYICCSLYNTQKNHFLSCILFLRSIFNLI